MLAAVAKRACFEGKAGDGGHDQLENGFPLCRLFFFPLFLFLLFSRRVVEKKCHLFTGFHASRCIGGIFSSSKCLFSWRQPTVESSKHQQVQLSQPFFFLTSFIHMGKVSCTPAFLGKVAVHALLKKRNVFIFWERVTSQRPWCL